MKSENYFKEIRKTVITITGEVALATASRWFGRFPARRAGYALIIIVEHQIVVVLLFLSAFSACVEHVIKINLCRHHPDYLRKW